MSWSPEGDLQFLVFRKKGQQLKYVGQERTHTPGTLRAIPSEVLNHRAKLTSRNPSIHSEAVDKIYSDHANALRKAGLAPPIFEQCDIYEKIRMRRWIVKRNETSAKRKTEMYNFVLRTHVTFLRLSTG